MICEFCCTHFILWTGGLVDDILFFRFRIGVARWTNSSFQTCNCTLGSQKTWFLNIRPGLCQRSVLRFHGEEERSVANARAERNPEIFSTHSLFFSFFVAMEIYKLILHGNMSLSHMLEDSRIILMYFRCLQKICLRKLRTVPPFDS